MNTTSRKTSFKPRTSDEAEVQQFRPYAPDDSTAAGRIRRSTHIAHLAFAALFAAAFLSTYATLIVSTLTAAVRAERACEAQGGELAADGRCAPRGGR